MFTATKFTIETPKIKLTTGVINLKFPDDFVNKSMPIYPETRLLGKVIGILGKSKING